VSPAGFHKVREGIEEAIEMGYDPVKVTYLSQNMGFYNPS